MVRTELQPAQTLGIIQRLKEPYSTLVMLLGHCGRRIEEAIGIKPTDLDDNDVLHIRRIIYKRRVEELEEERRLMYVACTRAKENLFITYPMNIFDRESGMILTKPSRFIRGIDEKLLEPWVVE